MNIRWPILLFSFAAIDGLACEQPLRAGLLEEGVLYSSATERGIDKDLMQELSKRIECSIAISIEPRIRQWRALADGQLDMTTGARPTAEREVHSVFYPYIQGKPITVARTGISRLGPSEFIVNRSLRLGVVRGYSYGPRLDQIVGELQAAGDRLVEVPTADQLIGLLRGGRVDAFLSLPTVMGQWADIEQTARQIDWVPQEPAAIGSLAVSRSSVSTELRDKIAAAIKGIRDDGTMKAILYRHLAPEIADLLMLPQAD
ncbi:substrate-binding periplasmic protein [Lacibacterium aquatile]|uniref:Substrate-binding periplasmic protein n=1 Tax=Lacibacterium aquatile TaxID=1168082 RepID=A0ABW5DL15_9PROT